MRSKKGAGVAAGNTLATQVTSILREEIVAGDLAPGELIAEIPTAQRLGVSRLPVREATSILEREGLLVLEGRGRRRIRSLNSRDLLEILEIRLLLETKLAALAAEHRSNDDLKALDENLEKTAKAGRLSQVSLLDIEFHDLIAVASHHSRLTHLWRMMRGHIQLFTASLQRQKFSEYRIVRESTATWHARILKYIRIQDSQGAAACIEKHLQPWKTFLDSSAKDVSN